MKPFDWVETVNTPEAIAAAVAQLRQHEPDCIIKVRPPCQTAAGQVVYIDAFAAVQPLNDTQQPCTTAQAV